MLLLWAAFSAFAFVIYWEALRGPFISDDLLYIASNPWTMELSVESIWGILNPVGESRFQTANYAPLHLLATAVERRLFWDDPLGYHVVNVLVHALNALLLVLLFARSGLSTATAFFAALLFLVHPANVEAVAWASQLKTNGSLALSLGALLLFRRHPGGATALFVAALLTKASAWFVLPMAATWLWIRGAQQEGRRPWLWLGVWTLAFALYSVPQYTAFHPRGGVDVPAYADSLVHLRTIGSIGVRYLVMAATSWGISHAPEHPPVIDPFDAWWLVALPTGLILVWRVVVTLRRRSPESMYWVGAAAAFGPVSQILPFSHPMGPRYLYFILPGLLGGACFALRDASRTLRGALPQGKPAAPSPRTRSRVATAVVLGVAIFFAVRASERAELWSDERLLSLDSARHFPEGRSALYLSAQRAAQRGDVRTAVAQLREAARRGRELFQPLLLDPSLAPIRRDPAFRELVREVSGRTVERIRSQERQTQSELAMVAVAHFERGEYEQAEQALESALARGGIMQDQIASELDALRGSRSRPEATRADPPDLR